jgi:hypothetical protein
MPGGQGRMSGTPPPRRLGRCAHSSLTACPGTTPRRPRLVAGEGRAFGACCFAGKLPQPCRSRPRATVAEAVDPYAGPYAEPYAGPYAGHPRTPHRPGPPFPLAVPPRGASRPQTPRPTSPPRGSGAAAPQGALRAIDSTARPRSWRTFGPRRLRRQSQPACSPLRVSARAVKPRQHSADAPM